MKVEKDHVVSIEYHLRLADGTEVDQSGPDPLQYIQGHEQIVPGLERELEGMAPGERKQVVVQPQDGYGVHDPSGITEVPRGMFPEHVSLEVGQRLTAQGPAGELVQFEVKTIGDEQVTVDLNHPLAGKELHFEVHVTGIRPATGEELSHGHAHGPGGAHA